MSRGIFSGVRDDYPTNSSCMYRGGRTGQPNLVGLFIYWQFLGICNIAVRGFFRGSSFPNFLEAVRR